MDREKNIELSISDVSLDKAELIARGNVHCNGKTGRFFYSLYDGKVSVISESGDISKDIAFVGEFIRQKVLAEVFPLAGEEFIAGLLEKEKTTVPMTNGFVQVNVDLEPSDVLVQLCEITSKEQFFMKDRRFVWVKPYVNGYRVMQEGQPDVLCRTYSDVVAHLGGESRKIFEAETIERGKKRIYRPNNAYRIFNEPDRGRAL